MRARRDNPAPTPTELLSSLQKLENFQADCVKRRTVADTARHVLHGPVKAALAQRQSTVERSLAPPPTEPDIFDCVTSERRGSIRFPGYANYKHSGAATNGTFVAIRRFRAVAPASPSSTRLRCSGRRCCLHPGADRIPFDAKRCSPAMERVREICRLVLGPDAAGARCALLSHLAPLSADERFPAVQAAGGREGRSNIERMAGRSIIAGGRPRSDGRDAAAHLGSPPLKSPSCARVRSFRLRTV